MYAAACIMSSKLNILPRLTKLASPLTNSNSSHWDILHTSLLAQHSWRRISQNINLGQADLLIMHVARAPVALQLASASRLAVLLVIAGFFATSVFATAVVTYLQSVARELIMHSISDSVYWQLDILEV